MSTIIVSAILLAIISGTIYKLIRDKKDGKGSCGCGCSSCPISGKCSKDTLSKH